MDNTFSNTLHMKLIGELDRALVDITYKEITDIIISEINDKVEWSVLVAISELINELHDELYREFGLKIDRLITK